MYSLLQFYWHMYLYQILKIMKKTLFLLVAACMSMGIVAQDFNGVSCQEGEVYHGWKKCMDYINIVMPLNIYNYEKIYLCAPDISKIEWPDKTDNKYKALEESLSACPGLIAKNIKKQLPHLKVQVVGSLEDMKQDDKSIGLCLRFDELDMGDRALRIWVGAGAGAQKMTISGVFFDKNKKEFVDFQHRRVTIIGRTYKKDLQLEFVNYGNDIAKMLDLLSK